MNKSRSSISGTCDLCQKVLTAPNSGQLARMMGYHKRVAHQIMGSTASTESRRHKGRMDYWIKKKGMTPQQAQAAEDAYQAKRAVLSNATSEVPKKFKRFEQPEPMALTACPFCHARFYGVRGNKEVA